MVAARFRILSEPFRLRLLERLSRGECSVGQLVHDLGASQPNVSKHLKLLLEAGLVSRRQNKNVVYYSLADDSVMELCDLVCTRLHDRLTAQMESLDFAR